MARKDYNIQKKRYKERNQNKKERREAAASETTEDDAIYDPELDDLKCILYLHGGKFSRLCPM